MIIEINEYQKHNMQIDEINKNKEEDNWIYDYCKQIGTKSMMMFKTGTVETI